MKVRPVLIGGLAMTLTVLGGMLIVATLPDSFKPTFGGAFRLVDGDDVRVTDRSWPGKYLLIYFGYTYCPDVCPTTLQIETDALTRLGAQANRIQALFVTLDPRRDTPTVLKGYTRQFSDRLIGLTGSPGEIARVAREYHVQYSIVRTGSGPDQYLLDHSTALVLMAPGGRFIAAFSDESTDDLARKMAQRVR